MKNWFHLCRVFSIVPVCAMIVASGINLRVLAWQPSAEFKQIPIWPGAVPHGRKVSGPEIDKTSTDLIGGKPLVCVGNVTKPTITVYPAKGTNTGAAVIVFPGGGYQILAMDLEGTEVCDWLTARGVTCVLLKYRVPGERRFPKSGAYPKSPEALEDAQRALRLVRHRAGEWNIDPHKIGVLGFSAGGHLAAAMSTHFNTRLYKNVDAADKLSCRPDFAVVVYPGHLAVGEQNVQLTRDVPVSKKTPPTFILQAENDPVDRVEHSLVYYSALRKAGVPVEMHLYAEGGHAFGLRRTKQPITAWPQLVDTWLETIGMVSKK